MISLRVLDYENHSGDEWITISYRRWWWPWFSTTKSLFSGNKYNIKDFTDEHGRYVKSGLVRDLLTRYQAEQRIADKLLEERNAPGDSVTWNGLITPNEARYSSRNSAWFKPEDKTTYSNWLIDAEDIPKGWMGQRVKITMEKL